MKQFLLLLLMSFSGLGFSQIPSLFDQLQADDVVEIGYFEQGCFGSSSEIITLKNDQGQLMSSFQNADGLKQSKGIGLNQLTAIKSFEEDLMNKKNSFGLCTNTRTYVLKFNGKIKSTFIDSSCGEWTGFSALKEKLFSAL